MNKLILLLLLITVSGVHAEDLEPASDVVDLMAPMAVEEAPPVEAVQQEPMEEVVPIPASPQERTPAPATYTTITDSDDFNPRKSHWLTTFGFEGLEYPVPLDFVGEKKMFKDEDRELYGGRIGLGREFYLGRGFNTTTKMDGFYMGTLFEKATTAAPQEVTEEFAFVKETGHIWGGEVSQSLGFLFNMKTKNPFMEEMTYLTAEPFIFAGIGMSRAYNRINYQYDTTVIDEAYRTRVVDNITSSSWGGGINFTANTGYFLYLKATQYRLNISKRSEEGFSRPNGQAQVNINRTSTNVASDIVTIYALGGGYKF